MTTKLFEVLDKMTCIPVVALDCQAPYPFFIKSREYLLLRRVGYSGDRLILLGKLGGGEFVYNHHYYPKDTRTMPAAHKYIEENWDRLISGDVIDVEFILGETDKPRTTDLA